MWMKLRLVDTEISSIRRMEGEHLNMLPHSCHLAMFPALPCPALPCPPLPCPTFPFLPCLLQQGEYKLQISFFILKKNLSFCQLFHFIFCLKQKVMILYCFLFIFFLTKNIQVVCFSVNVITNYSTITGFKNTYHYFYSTCCHTSRRPLASLTRLHCNQR